jgi:KEOPS complex subunit Cgi121
VKVLEGRVQIGAGTGVSDETEPARGTFDSVDGFLESLAEIGEDTGATIQAFDARYVAGEAHLRSAVEHATRAIERGENVADEPAVEVLLYAAGRRQIDQAMEMGVGPGDRGVVVVVTGGEESEAAEAVREVLQPATVDPDPSVLADFFGITEVERQATPADLETLVCERVALLDVEK